MTYRRFNNYYVVELAFIFVIQVLLQMKRENGVNI